MPLLPLLAFAAIAPSAVPDVYEKFAKNDAAIGRSAFDRPSPLVTENLEILVNAVRDAARSEVAAAVSKFDRLAKKNDDGFATSFSWAAGSKMQFEHFTAVAVSYGPIGRVAVFEGDQKAKGGVSLSYMIQRSPRILSIEEDGLLVASSFVRDAGMRDNTRIDAAHILLGRARNSIFVKESKRLEFEHTIEWGGAVVKNRQLVVNSVDSPKSFFFAEFEALLRHRRVYEFSGGELSLKQDQPGDLELRSVDDWLTKAQKAANPSPEQTRARKILPSPGMVMGHKVTPNVVSLELDGGTLVFNLTRTGGGFRVTRVTVK